MLGFTKEDRVVEKLLIVERISSSSTRMLQELGLPSEHLAVVGRLLPILNLQPLCQQVLIIQTSRFACIKQAVVQPVAITGLLMM